MKGVNPLEIFAASLISAALAVFMVQAAPCKRNEIEIVQNGEVVEKISLSETDRRVIHIRNGGHENQILIENGTVRMAASDCRDQVCVKMGALTGTPIVCLPNRLVVKYTEGGAP